MEHQSTFQAKSRTAKWWDERLPIMRLMHDSFVDFPTPRNLNYLWTFGGILSFCLVVQLVTGIVLAMHYVPSETLAFDSVEAIRRDVNYGWLLRSLHAVGASMFFFAVYVHIFRGLYYGSYKAPREVLWIIGVLIYLAMMATAFLGYTLPWGQMSFWGATVITNFFSAIPVVGPKIVTWLWGGYSVTGVTLNRFYSLHYLLPFVIAGLVVLHVWALHTAGQNNPTGVDIKTKSDAVPMSPYALMKDIFALSVFAMLFAWFVFFAAGLSRPRRQLRASQPAGDAAAYRAGVVLPAVLRHSARDSLQARRRDRDVLGDRRARVHSLARHQPRAVDEVPADLSLVLPAVRVHLPGARLSRRQAR